MALNVDKLREGLKDYANSLQHHLSHLKSDYESLMNFYMQFANEYDGQAANEFKTHWERTACWFEDYITASNSLLQTLEERIQYLENV